MRSVEDGESEVEGMPISSTGYPTPIRETNIFTRGLLSTSGTRSGGITASSLGTNLDTPHRAECLVRAGEQDELGGSPGVRAPATASGSSRESGLGKPDGDDGFVGENNHCSIPPHLSLAAFGASAR